MEIKRIEKEQAWRIRHEVMWPDKDLDFVKLPDDEEGSHFGLFLGDQLVSAVSLFVHGAEAQFRKFATLPSHQKKGYGSRLLSYVLEEAERAGANRIVCNARSEKAPFYEKLGLSRTDSTFSRSGRDYIVMERRRA